MNSTDNIVTSFPEMELNLTDFEKFRKLIYDVSGINLNTSKMSLLRGRLATRLRKLKMTSYSQYFNYINKDSAKEELIFLIDAISTNKTYFYREPDHFEYFKDFLIPDYKNQQEILIWSAGCSTGEEPYSIAMSVLMHMANPKTRVKILATDINTEVIAKAKEGLYQPPTMEGIPEEMRKRFFTQTSEGYYVKPMVKELVHFRRLNLVHPFPMKKLYDLIWCRNVMIYFDKPTITNLVNRFHSVMKPGGILFTGHSETLNSLPVKVKYVKTAVYQKQ